MKTKAELELSPWVVEELKLRAKVCGLTWQACAVQILEAQAADDRDERRKVQWLSEQSDKRNGNGASRG